MSTDTRDALIAAIATTAAILVQVALTDPVIQITLKAWWARVKAEWRGAVDAYDAGEQVVEFWTREDGPKVIDEATRIARESEMIE
jgi:hypothetical protein